MKTPKTKTVTWPATRRFQAPWKLSRTVAGALAALAPLYGQCAEADLFEMSMEQLSQVELKSDITSIRSKSLREQPGIVSVITAPQIQETGARDLSDVLMLVPGFSMDTDVNSLIGLTFRGLQGQEGKVLLVIDGIEVNEPLYGSLPILNHVPADMIEQVEIIRGPGPASYGGTAGLSVIRVTTKGANLNGGYAVVTPSYAPGSRFSENYAAGIGYAKNDWRFSFNADYDENYISDRIYTANNGAKVDMTHQSNLNPLFLDMGAGYRDLDFRIIYDAYHYKDPIGYGSALDTLPTFPNDISFDSLLTSIKYDLHATDWLKIVPEFTYRRQSPWEIHGDGGTDKQLTERFQGDLSAIAELNEHSSLLAGVRYQRDSAHALQTTPEEDPASIYYYGKPSIAFDDVAGYAQYDLDTPWLNVSLGGRYEDHDAVGGHFVPRIALTRAWEKFHLKALYSQAYRTPGIEVVHESIVPDLKAEQTVNYEMEAGYKIGHGWSVVGNLFYMEVDQPIIYTTQTGTDGYFNGHKISTAGMESELRWSNGDFSTYLSYSLYRAVENGEPYVRGDSDRFLAAPAHKITANATWHILKSLDWNINGFWLSQRLAEEFPGRVADLPPEFVANTFIDYRVKQFSFGVGVANLFDVNRFAPQPYHGGIGAVPLRGREVFAKIGYKF